MHYFVTYKNILRPQKSRSDYVNWLRRYWPVQQGWGAVSYHLWVSNEKTDHVLYCRYTVTDLDRWTASAASQHNEELVKALSRIIDMNRISIKIKADA